MEPPRRSACATQALDELAWELHVATQVPAQLVGLAAACERWWRLGWCGPGSGPAGVLGEGLAGWPGKGLVVARCRPRQGSCRGSGGLPRQGSCRGSSSSNPHLILSVPCLHKDLHATMEVTPEPWPNVILETVGSRVALSVGVGRAAPARVLPGEPASSLCSLWSWPWRCLGCLVLRLLFGFPPLPC